MGNEVCASHTVIEEPTTASVKYISLVTQLIDSPDCKLWTEIKFSTQILLRDLEITFKQNKFGQERRC
jgi:hypothetical protein